MGNKRGAYRVFVERPYGKRPLGRPRLRWGDNIIVKSSDLAEFRDMLQAVVNTVMNIRSL
jgi:hypothetical protein